ncbi:competence type IV pilus major pilin ComGC [Jeotgalibacillus salarius]|uniref:ComG operon protein 3 n=1 Tax=Jeotgalibacillus salarius TaxID=546023 RepID=A0A4Y8L620_9BACL|nr:competence type IV pilus major pilin ComGC [Jeotgalibacillus salarius]TFD97528.1 prepilin-type N-terminal cleavage/methylation domain-containing protein [Jeotgalibacillus salarius]
MRKKLINLIKNNRAFTLIEMVIVLLVISVLLIVSLPNISSQSKEINGKGCEAFQQMVQAQVESFRMSEKSLPADMDALQLAGYLNQHETTCPDGRELTIEADGNVAIVSEP